FLIDIAVPRDIDPQAHELDDVFVYDIDDLKGVVEQNRIARQSEVARVERIIEDEVLIWQKSQRASNAQPIMAALAGHGEAIRQQELEAALSKLSHLSQSEQEVVRRLASSL